MHTWAWIMWLIFSLITISSTRNPLYLILILLCLWIVYNSLLSAQALQRNSDISYRPPLSPLRIGMMLILISAVFNAAFSHYGETLIIRLPEWIPIIGGSITFEALVYGAINGLVLFCIFWSFLTLNLALPTSKMLRLIPKAFYPIAVVTSIAITFIPNTIRQFQLIKEAQAIRGHRLRGMRDWLPFVLPMLIGGLERAMALAEAMTARGFARRVNSKNPIVIERFFLFLGILLLLSGWFINLFYNDSVYAYGIIIVGIVILLITFWVLGKRNSQTTYMEEKWQVRDLLIILGAIIFVTLILLPIPFVNDLTLSFEIYPRLSLPEFDPIIGIAIIGLLIPALFGSTRMSKPSPD